ncbi:hypothetical protein [Clostridium sp.]
MRRSLFVIVILSMSIILSSCSVQKGSTTSDGYISKFTQNQWIEDIDYLEKNISENHINAYHAITKEDYEKKFNDLKTEVPKLKEYEIKMKLAQIIASIGDGHTSLYVNSNGNDKIYPVGVYWFGNELKVFAIDKVHKEVIGNSLVAINNITIEEVMTKVNTLISHENEQWLKYNNVNYIQMPEVLKFFNITKEDKTEFTFCDEEGKITKLNLIPQFTTKENIINVQDSTLNKPVSRQHDTSNDYNNLYWYKYIPEDKIMYFQYNKCIDSNTAQMSGKEDYKKYPDFSKFSNELIKELNEKEIYKFVIDLRNNSGGNSNLMPYFLFRLSNIKKLNEKGKIFVLIGRETFSSGVIACVSLENSTNAIFYGEPTGGNVNCYGDVSMITLPNSKINVSYSTKYFELSPEYKENFTPDITVEQSFDNTAKGIDDVYEAVKSYKN